MRMSHVIRCHGVCSIAYWGYIKAGQVLFTTGVVYLNNRVEDSVDRVAFCWLVRFNMAVDAHVRSTRWLVGSDLVILRLVGYCLVC